MDCGLQNKNECKCTTNQIITSTKLYIIRLFVIDGKITGLRKIVAFL